VVGLPKWQSQLGTAKGTADEGSTPGRLLFPNLLLDRHLEFACGQGTTLAWALGHEV
jgi:hypothetical protein